MGERERVKGERERNRGREKERDGGAGRNTALHKEHWTSRRRRSERKRGREGGRQLLKAIALPPGCLRRAESVEMLNLA